MAGLPTFARTGPPLHTVGVNLSVMARILCVLVLCWCLARETIADGPARVRELDDPSAPAETLIHENDEQEVHQVQSGDYSVQISSGLEWLSAVTAQRGFKVSELSSQCLKDMELYWKELENGSPWATRMYDATGRYSSQLLFGNYFWLGSLSLCYEVEAPHYNVSFRVAKLAVTISNKIFPETKLVPAFMGLCQPSSCSTTDTQRMLSVWTMKPAMDHKQNTTDSISLKVISVRPVPGTYSVLQDPRFQTISGTMLIILVIVLIGSTYEYLKSPPNESTDDLELKGENNNAFERNADEEKDGDQMKQIGSVEELADSKKDQSTKRKSKPKVGLGGEFLLAFSAIENGKQILSLKNHSDGAIRSIHGLRVISLSWVILVHTYLQLFAIGGNRMIREVTERNFMFQTIGNATYSVDTFFFISGLLMSYLYIKNIKKRSDGKHESVIALFLEFIKLVVYRLIRLTPVYIVVVGIVQQSMAYIHNSSVFEPNILDHYNCDKYWWRNILYINNFYPRTEMCMLWSWYLAADTQFFTLSAIILLLAKRRFKLAIGILGAILVSAWCTTAFISYTNQYQARLSEPFGLFDELYDKPWTRIGPYIIGMATGWFMTKIKKGFHLPLPWAVLGWVLALATLISIVFGLGSGLGVALSTVYVSLGHTAWGVSLAWIAVACHTGHGGVINHILGSPMLYPLSRLTFCAYLVHPAIMVLTSFVMDGSFHIHNGLVVIIFLGNTIASFLLAFLLSIGFEAPIVKLLKLVMK